MNPNKLTTKAQEALQSMQSLARERGNQSLEPEHLLLALLDQPEGAVAATLQHMNIAIPPLRRQIDSSLDKKPQVSGGEQYMSRELRDVLEGAEAQAKALQDEYTSTEHFLLALIKIQSDAAKLLNQAGVTSEKVLKALVEVRGSQRVT